MACVPCTVSSPYMTIRQNVDLLVQVEVYDPNGVPADLTGYTAKAQIKNKKGGTLLAEIVATIIDPTGGIIQLFLAQAICETLTFTGTAVYDLIIEDGSGLKYFVTEGKVYRDEGVTT